MTVIKIMAFVIFMWIVYIGVKVWLLIPDYTCASCLKPITRKEVKQFDNQCESCWYEMCQERTLNEEIE